MNEDDQKQNTIRQTSGAELCEPSLKSIRVLFVEDSEDDMLLIIRELRRSGYDPLFKRVDTAEAMLELIEKERWDIIISDYSMPRFNGLKALKLYQDHNLPIPFIVVSGTIGESFAVETMKAGAHDYMMKGHLKRLAPAIERELREAKSRRERRKALRELKDSETRFQDLYDNAPDMYVSVAPHTAKIIQCNLTLANHLGYTKEEIIGCQIFDMYHPDCMEKVIEVFDLFQQSGSVSNAELQLKRKDGSKIDVSLNVSSVHDDQGNLLHSRSSWRDISDQKKLEGQLRQLQKMEAIGTLAGGIAHDFNNILSSIIGYTELAVDDAQQGSRQREHLTEVVNAGRRATELVKQILTFARQKELALTPVKVKTVVNEVLKFLRASLPSTIDIRTDLQADSVVMADATQIHQIIMNICTNAGHAMKENGGVLKISLVDEILDSDFTSHHSIVSPGNYVKMTVADSGHGVPADKLVKIFDPYFTTKAIGEGTGMGLSVVLGIIQSHHGTIIVDSTPEVGTTFNIYLPIVEKQVATTTKAIETIRGGQEHILIVDDEAPIVKLLQKSLEPLGYKVTTSAGSHEALDLFKKTPDQFDLLITDMTMPAMTGDKLAIEILKVRPDMPIVLCTGYSDRISKGMIGKIGIKSLLKKPVGKKVLQQTVRRVLDDEN
ncbi:MAG: response regulator [Desulfobacteraceae bacterium]|jgi:PAS domain S-box-containing protein|nr:response regulator [Desulfobacteraceae bacterium]